MPHAPDPAHVARKHALRASRETESSSFADVGEVDIALGHLAKAEAILRKYPALDIKELKRLIVRLRRRLQ